MSCGESCIGDRKSSESSGKMLAQIFDNLTIILCRGGDFIRCRQILPLLAQYRTSVGMCSGSAAQSVA